MDKSRTLKQDVDFKSQKLAKTSGRRRALEKERALAQKAQSGGRNDLLPDMAVVKVRIADLRPSPHRARRLSADQVGRLMSSIGDLGFTVPILVNGGEIVDGHIRVEAAKRLGLAEVPAIEITHLTPAELRKLRLALNRTAELGEWDLDQLRIEITELIDLDVDLSSTGFSATDIDIILLDEEGADDEEEQVCAADEASPVVSQTGDLWYLGEHRLLCGNALEPLALKTLLDGRDVHAVLTDPPYNVPIAGNVSGLGKKTHAEFAMASGEMNDAEWQAFLDEVMAQLSCSLVEGGVIFAFMDWRSVDRLYAAGFKSGLNLINLVVWYKEAGGMGGLYRSAHELVAIFCKGKSPRINNVGLGKNGRNRNNVWVAPGANRRGSSANEMLEHHATPKPVELCVDALLDVTDRGDVVLDIFLGSGTTLIACQKAGRICCGIEIEPQFVDIAIRRWQRLTGGAAILAATGESFTEAEAVRQAADASIEHGEAGNV